MKIIITAFAMMLALFLIIWLFQKIGRNTQWHMKKLLQSKSTTSRQMTEQEQQQLSAYLSSVKTQKDYLLQQRMPKVSTQLEAKLTIFALQHEITHYHIANKIPTNRYYVANQEIYLPLVLTPHIKRINHIEIAKTTDLPLIITLNGHSILNS